MSDTGIAKEAGAVAAAVTGAKTPNNVRVKRPAKAAIGSLFAGIVLNDAIVVYLTHQLTATWPEIVMKVFAHYLGWSLIISVFGGLILAFAVATPWVGGVEASAGQNHVKLNGR